MEPFSKRPRVEGPGAAATPAEEVITFHLLKKDGDGNVVIESNGNFPPEMSHQLFGEKEEIVGYDGLSIDVWLTPQFQAFIDVKYAAKGPGATELKEPFAAAFASGFVEEKAAFDRALQEEAALDPAVLGKEMAAQETEEGSTFRVFHAHLATADPALKALHARLQPLLFFFVDAASPIDPSDEGWQLLTAVEQSPEGVEVLGYAVLYRYYHYPQGARLRLSQILVLPPQQGRGAGTMLLQAATRLADEMGACDLAFEEPAEGLQALRTTLDVRRALALGWARDAAQQRLTALAASNGKAAAAPAVNGGGRAARLAALEHPLAAPAELLERLRRELRLSRLQAGAVWRVLVYVTGGGTPAAVAGVQDMIRQQLVAQLAAAKDDAQGKSMRETKEGFVMCRGANTAKRTLPLLPVEERSAEQQAAAIEESAEEQLAAVAAVAAKFLEGDE